MKRLRKTCSIIPRPRIRLFRGVPSGPEEEKDIAKKNTEDFEVLAQVDLNQADDGLISPALIDLSHQHSGKDVAGFIFIILGHRNVTIEDANIDGLLNIQYITVPLLKAVATALTEALRNEHSQKAADLQGIDWDAWVRNSLRILLCMSNYTCLPPLSGQVLSDSLSVASPRFLDNLIGRDRKTTFMRASVPLIVTSLVDPAVFRRLDLNNFPLEVREQILDVIEEIISERREWLSNSSYGWSQFHLMDSLPISRIKYSKKGLLPMGRQPRSRVRCSPAATATSLAEDRRG